jgi:hypothetical protein
MRYGIQKQMLIHACMQCCLAALTTRLLCDARDVAHGVRRRRGCCVARALRVCKPRLRARVRCGGAVKRGAQQRRVRRRLRGGVRAQLGARAAVRAAKLGRRRGTVRKEDSE